MHVVVVLGNLPYNAPRLRVVNAGDIVHAACDEEDAVGRPCEIIDLRAYGPAHCLDTPGLLVFQTFLEVVRRLVFSGYPEQHVSIVTGAGKHLSSWTPSYNIDGLGMLYEGGKIGDLALVPMRLDVPEPNIVVSPCGC